MAENKDEQLTDEELAQLQLAEENENAVDRLVQELGCPTRRIRQFAARVLHLLAERDPQRVVPCVPALIEELYTFLKQADARELGWWRDVDTGLSFSEASLMYAWQIEGEAGADGATAGAHRG